MSSGSVRHRHRHHHRPTLVLTRDNEYFTALSLSLLLPVAVVSYHGFGHCLLVTGHYPFNSSKCCRMRASLELNGYERER